MDKDNKLEQYGIHELRALARKLGISSPTTKKRQELLFAINEILLDDNFQLKNDANKLGRPAKINDANMDIFDLLPNGIKSKEFIINNEYEEYANNNDFSFKVACPSAEFNMISENIKVEGLVEVSENGYGILRTNGFFPTIYDMYIPKSVLLKNNLVCGEHILCIGKNIVHNKPMVVVSVEPFFKNKNIARSVFPGFGEAYIYNDIDVVRKQVFDAEVYYYSFDNEINWGKNILVPNNMTDESVVNSFNLLIKNCICECNFAKKIIILDDLFELVKYMDMAETGVYKVGEITSKTIKTIKGWVNSLKGLNISWYVKLPNNISDFTKDVLKETILPLFKQID